MKRISAVVIALLSLLALVAATRPPESIELIADRSFAITDKAILEPFTFQRVLDNLTADSGVTSEMFFRQWWGLQAEPQCRELLNGSARRCPTTEGELAYAPFRPEDFIPIGITNRFDQANATQCGQYRLIFANRTVANDEAFHVIFEAEMPNPRPEEGLEGCRPVAQFWADLNKIESETGRRTQLEHFFFDGLRGFPPAIHADHFRNNQSGVRTLQLTRPTFFPTFYQYRIVRENGNPVMKQDVLENMQLAWLIDASNQDERAKRYRQSFLENVKTLAIPDANLYHMKIPSEFLIQDPKPADSFDFALNFAYFMSRRTPEGRAYEAEIASELRRIGSTLTPFDIINRAETQNCIGCHFTGPDLPVGEGVEFPLALDRMSHVSEFGGTATKFAISPAMQRVFIPHRMKILKDFLEHGTQPVHSN